MNWSFYPQTPIISHIIDNKVIVITTIPQSTSLNIDIYMIFLTFDLCHQALFNSRTMNGYSVSCTIQYTTTFSSSTNVLYFNALFIMYGNYCLKEIYLYLFIQNLSNPNITLILPSLLHDLYTSTLSKSVFMTMYVYLPPPILMYMYIFIQL